MHRPPVWIWVLLLGVIPTLWGCGQVAPVATTTPFPPTATVQPSPSPTPPPTATRQPSPTLLPTAEPPTESPVPEETAGPSPASTETAAPSPVLTETPAPSPLPTEPLPTATPAVVLTPLRDLPSLLDQEVTVQATIIWASSFSSGFKFLLDDGTGQATLLMWLSVYDDCWAAPDLIVGATVQASGTVGQFEGEWQVEPDFGGDVKVLSPGTPPPMREIGTITADDLTTRVTVEGTVTAAEAFSGGQRVYLQDGTGQILVLLWQNIFERIPDNGRLLTPGTTVRVSGVVEEYKGTLELVPQVPYAVTFP